LPLYAGKYRQAMHMPRIASRTTLRVNEVRLQRIQDISPDDCKAEGVLSALVGTNKIGPVGSYHWNFRELWNSINEPRGYGWDSNPWVFAYTYDEPILQNVDELEEASI